MFPQPIWCCREVLKDDIIPYAVKWFTGEAQMEDSDEEDFELDEDEEVGHPQDALHDSFGVTQVLRCIKCSMRLLAVS